MAMKKGALATVVWAAFLFLVTVLCYWPSLGGAFLFDDLPNLSELGSRGGITSIAAFIEFVTSGQSGPLGRPLSLASFVMNGQDWPTDPLPFRITNLLLHLVNGWLVFLLSRSLLGSFHDEQTARKLALACMALWLLHPLAASTTAYVIQRMTQLASLFTLTGLLAYVHGRQLLAARPRRGWLWIVVGMGTSGLLAVLSKETGVLLPLYALVIELTVFQSRSIPVLQQRSLIALLCAPLLVIAGYIAFDWDTLMAGFDFRPFSMPERLLTQAVVLVHYLRQVFLPDLAGLGIIHDDFPVSSALLTPVSTLLSILVIAGLLGLALWWRKRWPLVAFGILWFFAGHSLESGPLPLELYFDHRNYLPLLGPVIAVCSAVPALPSTLRRLAPVVLFAFLAFAAFLTVQSARLWANADLMMSVALIDHPTSLRARQHLANRHILEGRYEDALDVQLGIAADRPEHLSTRLSILNLRCLTNSLSAAELASTQAFLETAIHDQQTIGFFMPLLNNAAGKTCEEFRLDDYQATLDALLRNPVSKRDGYLRGALHYFKGRAYQEMDMTRAAVAQLDLSYDAVPETDVRLQQVVWLIGERQVDEADRYLDRLREHVDKRPTTRALFAADVDTLQGQIDALRAPR